MSFGGVGQDVDRIARLVLRFGVRELNGGYPTFVVQWSNVPVTSQ